MNEPPGARARVGLTGLTVAEYFRDEEGQDVLFFVDNIFRFTQAGSEVSALLGRIPSAVGYQPTLATDMGALQERITTTKKGSITSVQAIYVPADDLTDPAPATSFAHLDATTVLSRQIAELGIFPAVDPLDSTSRILDPPSVGEEHYKVARARAARAADLQVAAGHHRHPRHGRAFRRGQADGGARPQDPALPVPALPCRRSVHRHSPGKFVALGDTIKGFKGIWTASMTTCRSPPSTWWAPSRRRSTRPARWRPRPPRRPDGRPRSPSSWSRRARLLLSQRVDMVVVPGTEGDIGVLPGHAPLSRRCGRASSRCSKAARSSSAFRRRRLCRGDAGALHRVAEEATLVETSAVRRSRAESRRRPGRCQGRCRATGWSRRSPCGDLRGCLRRDPLIVLFRSNARHRSRQYPCCIEWPCGPIYYTLATAFGRPQKWLTGAPRLWRSAGPARRMTHWTLDEIPWDKFDPSGRS